MISSTAHADPPDSPDRAAGQPTEVIVRAAPRKRDPARVTISSDEGRRVAGAQGDALKAVESLPGVARAAFDSGKVAVWGAAPADTHVYVDGVEVPSLYHEGGLRGIMNADLVGSLNFTPGAYGADYGRGLGGLILLSTRDLPPAGIHGYLGADLLDASGLVSAAIGKRVRVAVAGRASYLDRILSGALPEEVRETYSIPRYRDYQAKASISLRQDEDLSVLILGAADARGRAVASADPARLRSESMDTSFHRAILRYSRTLDNGDTVIVTPFFGQDRSEFIAASSSTPAKQASKSWKYGVRASYGARVADIVNISLGVDALGTSADIHREGSLTVPPREGDLYVFGQSPGTDVNADDWTANIIDLSPSIVAELRLGRLTLTPGLRADAFLIESSRLLPRVGQTPPIGGSRLAGALGPRIAASFAWTNRLTLAASAGLYSQPPAPEDLSAVFGTPKLSLSRALHATASQAVRLDQGVDIEVTGYYERLDNLVVRSRRPTPARAVALTQDGEGQSYGVQILARRKLKNGLLGWIAYTAGRSERRYAGDAGYRPFDYDRTSALSAVASYEYKGWMAGARFRYTTGAPRTPVIGSFYEATSGQFQPIFGVQNAIRLPNFYELDLRLEKKFSLGLVALTVYLDVLNVTYHENAEEIVYSADYSQNAYIRGIPTLAMIGTRLEL